jgi:hypothetical protein
MPSFGHICILRGIHGMRKEAAEGPSPALASAPHRWCRRPCPTVGVVGTRSKPHRRCRRPHPVPVLVVLTPLLSAAISTHHPPCEQLLAAAEAGAVSSWGRCTCRRPHLILVVLVDRCLVIGNARGACCGVVVVFVFVGKPLPFVVLPSAWPSTPTGHPASSGSQRRKWVLGTAAHPGLRVAAVVIVDSIHT